MPHADAVLTTENVLGGKVDLRAYPYRHLAVYCYNKFRGDGVRQVLAAADLLSNYGWELINISEFTGNQLYGFMRRTAQPPNA